MHTMMNETEYRTKRIEDVERRRKQFENDLKAAGYYDGKPVTVLAGIDGLSVKLQEIKTDPIKIEDLRPVHCRCNLLRGRRSDK